MSEDEAKLPFYSRKLSEYRSDLVVGTDIAALQFLWSDYECHVYYFEVVEIMRRLILTAGWPGGVAFGGFRVFLEMVVV